MTTLLTLDASVVVAACKQSEPGFKSSRNLLEAIRDHHVPLIEPGIVLPEVSAALVRTGTKAHLAVEYVSSLSSLPLLTLVSLDEALSLRAAHTAAKYKLRGADAIYVMCAELYGATIITLDKEQLTRSPKSVHAMKPAAALTKLF